MTVDGPEERPLALRDLAQADSPEIVRAALGRFRRRLLVRGMILVLIAATGAFLYPRYFHDTGDLKSEIAKGRGVPLNNVIRNGELEATILRVSRLSGEVLAPDTHVERFGIQLSVFARPSGPPGLAESYNQIVPLFRADPDHGLLFFQLESNANIQWGFEVWLSLTAGTPTVDIPIAAIATNTGSPARLIRPVVSTLHIDMR
jgi:hypothetical protein